VLDFLVTSIARRRMLRLLWAQGESGSASRLAKRAGVGFASAYRELRAMRSRELVSTRRERTAEIYSANTSHPLAETLRALASGTTRRVDDDEARRVRGHLKALGAPLLEDSAETPTGEVEEALVRGVRLAHRDPAVARTLPICLYLQRDALRVDRLKHHARQLGEKRALGFFLDLAHVLSNDARFAAWARPLHDRRCTAQQPFFHTASRSSLQRRAERESTPAVARRWGLLMNMDMDAFRTVFEKFVSRP